MRSGRFCQVNGDQFRVAILENLFELKLPLFLCAGNQIGKSRSRLIIALEQPQKPHPREKLGLNIPSDAREDTPVDTTWETLRKLIESAFEGLPR